MAEEKRDKPAVVEASNHHPAAAIWRNQMVSVYEKDTQTKIDTGLVTEVTSDEIAIGTERYGRDKFDFQILA